MLQTNNRKEIVENGSKGRGPSKTAETLAIIRAMESGGPRRSASITILMPFSSSVG